MMIALNRDKFAASFAADLDPAIAAFRADSQLPWGVVALEGKVTRPAWRTKPSASAERGDVTWRET